MLEVRGISKSFGALKVVDDVSITVAPGTCLGIMGPNGAGKSTFFDLLTGLTPADAGHVDVAAQRISHLPAERRAQAGLARAFQVPRPFASLTVRETLLLTQHAVRGVSGPKAGQATDDILHRVGLSNHANTLGADLRLLDRKRLELAKALACEPKVILLDEISGGLSTGEVAKMTALVDGLKREGLAVLWIEHIAHALRDVSDRIMMLHLGRKLIEDTPEAVMANTEVRRLYLGRAA